MTGYVSKIESLGLSDGPGIRVVVFLSGCPLRCKYCHNPEMFKHNNGISYTPKDLITYILKYKKYFGNNGGVTFSGGEPLMQFDFLLETCKLLKNENIHIALDTCGINLKDETLLDYIDLILMDIKHTDKNEYKNITGIDKFDESISFIETCKKNEKEIWFRQVIIPGINDTEAYMETLKALIKKYKPENLELLPYHTLAKDKYKNSKIKNPLEDIPPMDIKKLNKLDNYLKSIL